MGNRKRLTKAQRLDVLHAAGGRCYLCGQIINLAKGEKFEVEHPVPLGLGGADSTANWEPAHKACHAEKTAKDRKQIAKANRVRAKNQGTYRAPRHIVPGTKASPFKKRADGAVIERATGRVIRTAYPRGTK